MDLEEILQQHGFDISSLSLPEYQRGGKEHRIYLLKIPTQHVLPQWEELHNLVPKTGYWPVIGWDRFKKPSWEEASVHEIIEAGLRVNIPQWFEQQGYRTILCEEDKARSDDGAFSPFVFRLHLGRFDNRLPPLAVPIALIPTHNFWEVPAYLTPTANEWDPSPAVHIAIMKYWSERWKAELVSMVAGVIEMRVLQPPVTGEEALTLAKEQYLYSPDLVDQGPGSIHALARMLLNSHVWRFWWD